MTRRDLLLAATAALLQIVGGCRSRAPTGAAPDLGPFPPQQLPGRYKVAPDLPSLNAVEDGLYHFTHHQAAAYCLWREILLGRLPRRGSVLINLDCHIDAWLPIGAPNPADRQPAADLLDDAAAPAPERLRGLARFLDEHLDYASWLTPIIESGIISEWYYVVPHRLSLAQARAQSVVKRWQRRWRSAAGLPEGLTPPQAPQGFVGRVVRLEDLPPAGHFRGRPVILSLDLDYYSNRRKTFEFETRPQGPSTPQEIMAEISATAGAFAARRLTEPALVLTSDSPQWVPQDQIGWIRTRLLSALRERTIAPRPWPG